MVKKKLFVIVLISFILIFSAQAKVLAKVSHFRSFMGQDIVNHATYSAINQQAIRYATYSLENLEFNNNYSSTSGSYQSVSSATPVRNYINQTGYNYAVAIFGHGDPTDLSYIELNGDDYYRSEVSGNWHLVILNVCHIGSNNQWANAFKTIGYSHRATIAFDYALPMVNAKNYWQTFYSLVCSDTLGNVSDYANSATSTHALVYGDWQWNGYAWW